MKKIWDSLNTLRKIFRKIKNYPLYAKKVRFAYDGKEILNNFNLIIKTSQIVAVVGKSGSGKTTFLNIISGVLTDRYQGDISILGRNREFAKEDLGYVPQEISVVPDLTIEENIKFFGSLNGLNSEKAVESGKKLMEIMKLDISLSRYPSQLSGGQRVRLNIIVSLLHNPKIIILDEPFVGLDYYNRKMLWHFLEYQRNRRKTIILTTHMLTEAEHHSDRIVLLNKGKILARGKLKDICEKLKMYYILELKLKKLNKSDYDSIEKYCKDHNISILDKFNNYLMFSIESSVQKAYLIKFIEKRRLEFEENGFREPNLDELFLRVGSDD